MREMTEKVWEVKVKENCIYMEMEGSEQIALLAQPSLTPIPTYPHCCSQAGAFVNLRGLLVT